MGEGPGVRAGAVLHVEGKHRLDAEPSPPASPMSTRERGGIAMIRSLHLRIGLFAAVCALFIGGFWFIAEPLPQPLSYHNFGDQRTMLDVPHALNVLSNFPFILVAALGIASILRATSRTPGTCL